MRKQSDFLKEKHDSWVQHLNAWKQGGLKQSEYCRRHLYVREKPLFHKSNFDYLRVHYFLRTVEFLLQVPHLELIQEFQSFFPKKQGSPYSKHWKPMSILFHLILRNLSIFSPYAKFLLHYTKSDP